MFGPRPRNYGFDLNKVKSSARLSAQQSKQRNIVSLRTQLLKRLRLLFTTLCQHCLNGKKTLRCS